MSADTHFGRTNFIAHEPALGHLAGAAVESGGAGFAVAEQTLALNAGSTRAPARIVCPAPRARRVTRTLPLSVFHPPAAGELETALLGDRWLATFDRLLGTDTCAAHHVLAARILSALGRPFACHLHSLWPSVAAVLGVAPDPTRAAAAHALLRDAAAVVVSTHAERTLLARTAVPASERTALLARTWVAPPGVNPRIDAIARSPTRVRARAAWRRRLVPNATTRTRVFYTVGRLVPHKGQATIVRAFLQIARAHRDVRLLLVGMPTDAAFAHAVAETIRHAPAHARRRIHWHRALPIEAAHLAGDVLVHASALESWGKVIDEAFALGNPTIVSALPTTAEKAGYAFADRTVAASARFTTNRFAFTPIGDDAPRSLLIDPHRVDTVAAALDCAATDARWRRACRSFNRQRAAALRWPRLVGQLTRVWEHVEAARRPPFDRAA